MVISSLPSTTITLTGGKLSSLSTPYRSTTARREFFSSSKQMCELSSAPVGTLGFATVTHRWPGTYGKVRSLGQRSWIGGPLKSA